ncbi:DNA-binding NarL/FixJ family response regulator [Dyadobacter jejuensis]|uniref:DNA-binding NarL/FixJ family response regulator n=1 Tax=Dyadobacter jejuensis TaxID=1082580 RepID=A0A316ASX8_9BACT|nr:response regulator transcription factor [Dyadobacter jejuensis]PWJ60628.1 DNA-binding NarL/FixJ family response regulator [Dyadobacter jejuensis]
MKHIIIAEDHAVVRIGTKHLLQSLLPDAEITGVDDFDGIITAMNERSYDLLILDINIPGGNNTKMVETIRAKAPDIKILMFSGYDEQLYGLLYLQAGADGYLSKDAPEEEFKTAVTSVLANRKYMSEEMQQININRLINPKEFQPDPVVSLSPRETDVMNLLKEGLGTAKIAEKLNLQLSTVSTYKARIFEKLGVKNIVELITKIK